MGTIAIEGMHFYAHHGLHKAEQVIGGQYIVDVYLTAELAEAAEKDSIRHTIDYEKIYSYVKAAMEKKANLIEHICRHILDAIFENIETASYIKVRVSKLNPPLRGTVDRVYVELEESRT